MTPEMMIGNGGEQPAPETAPQGDDDPAGMLRQIIMQLGPIAQRIPEAQAEIQAAASALTQASLKAVASQREPAQGQAIVGA